MGAGGCGAPGRERAPAQHRQRAAIPVKTLATGAQSTLPWLKVERTSASLRRSPSAPVLSSRSLPARSTSHSRADVSSPERVLLTRTRNPTYPGWEHTVVHSSERNWEGRFGRTGKDERAVVGWDGPRCAERTSRCERLEWELALVANVARPALPRSTSSNTSVAQPARTSRAPATATPPSPQWRTWAGRWTRAATRSYTCRQNEPCGCVWAACGGVFCPERRRKSPQFDGFFPPHLETRLRGLVGGSRDGYEVPDGLVIHLIWTAGPRTERHALRNATRSVYITQS